MEMHTQKRTSAREPSKCLNGQSNRERLAKQATLRLISHQRLRKKTDRAITPLAGAVCVPVHSVLPGSLQPKWLHHLHSQPTLEQNCHRQKKEKTSFASMHLGLLWSCPTLCDPGHCSLPGFSVRWVLQARILERIGQYCLPYSSRALYFLPPQPPTPLSTWCCQNPCDPSTCGPHWCRSNSSRVCSR